VAIMPLPESQTELGTIERWSLMPTSFMAGVVMISLGPMLDSILRDLRIPVSNGGIISVGFALGQLLGILLLNFFLARVPVRWSIAVATWVQSVALLCSAVISRGLWSLVGAYVFVGLGSVFLLTIPGVVVGSNVKKGAARAILQLLIAYAIGMMLTPVAIGVILGAGASWRWVLAGEAGLSLMLAVLLTLLPLPDVRGRENLRVRQVKEVIGFHPRLFATMAIAAFVYVGAEFILDVWLAKFETDTLGAGKAWAGAVVAIFWVGIVAGRFIVQPLTSKFPISRILLVGTTAMAVFTVGIAVSRSLVLTDILVFFAGLGAAASTPLILSYSARFPKWHAGVVFSAVMFLAGLGVLIFPYVVGPLVAATNFRVAIGLSALLAVGVAISTRYLHRAENEPLDNGAETAA
jgi:fucose permease